MARLVSDVVWTMDRWKRCGMSSKPGSEGFRGGRTRTAVFFFSRHYLSAVVRGPFRQTPRTFGERVCMGSKGGMRHTNFDCRAAIVVGSPAAICAASGRFARHAQAAAAPLGRLCDSAQGPLRWARRGGRRGRHGVLWREGRRCASRSTKGHGGPLRT